MQQKQAKLILSGAGGKMCCAIERLASAHGFQIAAKIDRAGGANTIPSFDQCDASADIVVDFSHKSAIGSVIDYCASTKTRLVCGTTGLDKGDFGALCALSKQTAVFYAPNMSTGVAFFARLVRLATAALGSGYDIEITEMHHSQKADAPSGTAKMLFDAVRSERKDAVCILDGAKKQRNEVGMHSIRAGGITGVHEVMFANGYESIKLVHTAFTRDIFADGALNAARFLLDKQSGLFGVDDLV